MTRPFTMPDPLFSADEFPGSERIRMRKGEIVLFEREQGSGNCFLVVEGSLDVRLLMAGGNETLLYRLKPGELVGELSLFLEQRTASIVAAEDSYLQVIRPAAFWQCFEDEGFRLRISSLFLSRYLRSHDVICRLSQPSVAMRICRYLLSLPEWKNCKGNLLTTNLPGREDMAHLLSCQRETVSRAFRKLLLMGLLEQSSRQQYTLDKQKLSLFLDDH